MSKDKLQPRHTARGIVVHEGQILLMERWRNGLHYFSIPGGGIESGETPEIAVEREILEETTIIVKAKSQVLEMRDGNRQHHIYVCEYISGEPQLLASAPESSHGPDNVFKPSWQPIEALATLPLIYWEPARKPLIEGLANGFSDQITIVYKY